MKKTCIQYIKEVAKKVINSELKHLGAAPTRAVIEGVMRTVGLATQYDFSGGQIDNIARKAIMNEIVKGESPTLATLQALCAEERISRGTTSKIGF